MEFVRYNSIKNTYEEQFVDDVRKLITGLGVIWRVTEKIDGTAIAIYFDGTDFKLSSRNQFDDGTHYNMGETVEPFYGPIRALYQRLGLDNVTLVLFAELYGKGIQGRIPYGERRIAVYDIMVDGQYIDMDWKVHNILRDLLIPTVPVLLTVNDLESALTYRNSYDSLIDMDDGARSTMEGIVISPITPLFLPGGSRVLFKSKSADFLEMKNREVKEMPDLSEKDQLILSTLLTYTNNARIMSAISKHGIPEQKDFGILMRMVTSDIFDEYGGQPKKDCDDWKTVSIHFMEEVKKELLTEFRKHIPYKD